MYNYMQSMVETEKQFNNDERLDLPDGAICRFMIIDKGPVASILKEKEEYSKEFGVPFDKSVRTLGLRLRVCIVGLYDDEGNYTPIIDTNTTSMPNGQVTTSFSWFPPEYLQTKGWNMGRKGLSLAVDETTQLAFSTLKKGGFPYLVNLAPVYKEDQYNKFSKEAYQAYVTQIDSMPEEFRETFAMLTIMRNHALGEMTNQDFVPVEQPQATHVVFNPEALIGMQFTGRLKVKQEEKKRYVNLDRIIYEDLGEKYKTATIAGKDFSIGDSPAEVRDMKLHRHIFSLLQKQQEEYEARQAAKQQGADDETPF